MSIASEITRLQTAKGDIKTAIEAKGVSVPTATSIAAYNNYIANIQTGGGVADWTPPSDWIDISSVNDNEINLLIGDFSPAISFRVMVTDGYTVNWGDGAIENFGNNATASHTYTVGAGQACSKGYTTFKIRIYAQTPANAITNFSLLSVDYKQQYSGLLWAKIGATGLTDCSLMFYRNSSPLQYASYLECIEFPTSLTSCTSFNSFAANCYRLQKVVMPYNYSTSNIDFGSAFANCYILPKVDYHATTLNVSTFTYAHSYNYLLNELILPSTINNCTNWTYFLQYTYSLNRFIAPTIDTNCNCDYMFYSSNFGKIDLSGFNNHITDANYLLKLNSALYELILPNNMPISMGTNINSMIANCTLLSVVTLPNFTNATITSVSSLIMNCPNITTINNFPILNSVTSVTYFAYNAYRLKTISNLDQLGNTTTGMNLADAFAGAYSLETLSLRMKITGRFVLSGQNTTYRAALNSLRLLNQASTFTGSSPQIDIRNTSMDTSALETGFNDLPNGLSGKVIAISGSTGCDTLINKTSCGTTSGSAIITQSNTSTLAVGMEVTGTGIDTTRSITLTDSGDIVTLAAHGIPNGKKVAFTAITGTTGIAINTPYYVVNATADTFQLSLTSGGDAIALTTDGTGTLKYIPVVTAITDNTNITLDIPCSATGTITASFGILKRSIAILKGWTVTN